MYISLFRDQILNPNEDDLKGTSAEELSKLVEMAVDLATTRRKGADSDSAEDYHRIQFVGEVEVLPPGQLDIPESEVGAEGGLLAEHVYSLCHVSRVYGGVIRVAGVVAALHNTEES